MNKTIIVITGLPCTGKTTIGKQIADYFKIPFLSKDEIKELIFDNLGYSDREFSKKAGRSALAIMFNYANDYLKKGMSMVFESNFKPEFDDLKFKELKEKYQANFIQILCHTDGKILFDRFKKRAESEDRHPGHLDSQSLDEWAPILATGKCLPLNIKGKLIEINTTNFLQLDLSALLTSLELEANKNK